MTVIFSEILCFNLSVKYDFKKAEMLKMAINFEFLEVFGWECDSQIPQIKPLGATCRIDIKLVLTISYL